MAKYLTAGTMLNGYTLIADMTTSDAGTSMWTFVSKDGSDYFLKCYLTPVYPDTGGLGSNPAKERKRDRCRAFEFRMEVVELMLSRRGDSCFLVRAIDFFRHNGNYFKVTRKVDSRKVDVSILPESNQMLVLLSASYALRKLHESSGFIHADIKPQNFMIQQFGGGFVANLIDFDAGFYARYPPTPDELVGDQLYSAPELIEWVLGEDGEKIDRHPALSQALDIFSLGLTFCEYLTGSLPLYPSDHAYPGEAVLDGIPLRWPEPTRAGLAPVMLLVKRMLDRNPRKRPSSKEVHEELRRFNQEHYVTDSTYGRLTGSVNGRVETGKKPVGDDVKLRSTVEVYKSASQLQVRGLKVWEPDKDSVADNGWDLDGKPMDLNFCRCSVCTWKGSTPHRDGQCPVCGNAVEIRIRLPVEQDLSKRNVLSGLKTDSKQKPYFPGLNVVGNYRITERELKVLLDAGKAIRKGLTNSLAKLEESRNRLRRKD